MSSSEMFGPGRLIQLTCNPPLTNFTLTKLLWVRETEPANWARVAHVMLPKDYVRFRLTGDRAIDMADASGTLLLDVANRRWSAEVLSKTGISEQLLPQLYESPQVCGRVSAAGAEATGLRAGTPVVAGAGRSSRGRRGNGHCARRGRQRHDWHVGRGLCGDRPSRARSARTDPHFLSRGSGTLARDGRNPGCGIISALVSGSLRSSVAERPRSVRRSGGRSRCRAGRVRGRFSGCLI